MQLSNIYLRTWLGSEVDTERESTYDWVADWHKLITRIEWVGSFVLLLVGAYRPSTMRFNLYIFMAAELPWCLYRKWIRSRMPVRVVVTFLFQTNMRENAIFVLAIEIIGSITYLALISDRFDAENLPLFTNLSAFVGSLFAQSFVLASFGISQAYIAKLLQRVSFQMQEKGDLLNSVQEGVVVVSNLPS